MNILGASKLFLTPQCLGFIMEHADGGSLASYVGERWRKAKPHSLVIPEDETLYLFKQFISAVSFCHRHNLAHRYIALQPFINCLSQPVLRAELFACKANVWTSAGSLSNLVLRLEKAKD